jgi:hypothetical protein
MYEMVPNQSFNLTWFTPRDLSWTLNIYFPNQQTFASGR